MKTLAGWLATFAVLGMLGTAWAESGELPAAPRSRLVPDTLFVKTGLAQKATAGSLGLGWDRSDWLWSALPGALSFTFELEIGHWRTVRLSQERTAEFTQFGVTPMLRYTFVNFSHSEWFADGGVGFHFIVPLYHSEKKRFSTNFNFQDLIGAGARFGAQRRHEVALYVSHFSNGDIKRPNPGENFLQLRYLRHFD